MGAALVSGLVAGLGVAMPLGAVGVLLVREGALRGVRRALPGATAVACVDTVYCALAVLTGAAAAPLVASWRPWPALVGGVALLVVAALGLRRGLVVRRAATWPDDGAATVAVTDDGGPAVPGAAAVADDGSSGWRRYALFLGLTAVNPATLVYFAALVSGLAGLTSQRTAAAAFVIGVGAASFGWQALLVVVGGLLGGRAAPGARRTTVVVGNAVVALLGVVTLTRALA